MQMCCQTFIHFIVVTIVDNKQQETQAQSTKQKQTLYCYLIGGLFDKQVLFQEKISNPER